MKSYRLITLVLGCTLMLSLNGAVGQTLTYLLLSDSTITPAPGGVPSGPVEALNGNFTMTRQNPSGYAGGNSFVVSDLEGYTYLNASYYYSMSLTNLGTVTTKANAQGQTALSAYVMLMTNAIDRLHAMTNPWSLRTSTSGTYFGPASSPARLVFDSVGLYPPSGSATAILHIDAMMVGDSANTNTLTNAITINATAYVQSPATLNTNNFVSVTPPPVKLTVNNAQLLAWLAQDEYAAGNYGQTNFPAGARLVDFVYGPYGPAVLDENGNLLVSVSDILNLRVGNGDPSYVVETGKLTPEETFAPTQNRLEVFGLTYDDGDIDGGLGLQFYLQGLASSTLTDTTPDANGAYTQTIITTMNNGAGSGAFTTSDTSTGARRINILPFVITGSLSSSGKSVRQE